MPVRSLLACLLAALALPLFAQRGDLPIPADYESGLIARGAVEVFLPVQPDTLTPAPADLQRGWLIYQRQRNREVLPNSKPAPSEALARLTITATPGELESQPFSVYALADLEEIAAAGKVTATGASAWLAAAVQVEDVLFHPVQYRRPEQYLWPSLSYLRYPVFLRPTAGRAVPHGASRLYWVTVTVPENTPAGSYRAAITLRDSRGGTLQLPLEVRVLPFHLTANDLPRFGAFLSGEEFSPGEWALMKRYGMDALQWFWPYYQIRISNDNGRIALDFTRYDAMVRGMQQAGMRGPLVLSLGNSFKGDYEGALARAFGLPMLNEEIGGRVVNIADFKDARWDSLWVEGLRLIFEHGKEANWPELALLIHDEPTKHILAYHSYKYQLVKRHFPEIPVYGVFFEPEKELSPLLKTCDIMVANRDLQRIKMLAQAHGKRFWSYINVCADQSFGRNRMLYGQIPAYYGSEVMFFWSWDYWVGSPWDDFDGWGETAGGPTESDADWVAVYPSQDGREPVRTLALEAAREAIDDVRYLKTLEEQAKAQDPARWAALAEEIRRRQQAMFGGIFQDNRTYAEEDFYRGARPEEVEELRGFAIAELLKLQQR